MNVAFGVLFLWTGAAALWVAFHGTDLSSPWAAFTALTGAIGQQAAPG
jgi:hypothetical protein